MYFLRELKKINLPKTMMVYFYSAIIDSILTSSITIWYAAATSKDKSRLQRIIHSAKKVIGCNLPSLQDLHASRALKERLWPTPPTPDTNCFRHSPLAGGCSPSGPKPHATRTVSSRLQLASSTGPPLTLTVNLCFWLALLAFTLSYIFLLTMFIVMHQHTKTNSLYVKTYLAIKLILILIRILLVKWSQRKARMFYNNTSTSDRPVTVGKAQVILITNNLGSVLFAGSSKSWQRDCETACTTPGLRNWNS